MILRYCKIITSVILLSFAPSNGSWIDFHSGIDNKFLYESKLIMKSLEEALNYFTERPETVNDDVVLGFLITNANLRWIYNKLKYHSRSDSWKNKQLEGLLGQCHDVIESNKSGSTGVLNESLWEKAAGNLRSGLINPTTDKFLLPEFDSYQSIDEYAMKGTPNDSDICINELVRSGCKVSEDCWLSEANEDPHFGYKTSHRLLYFQIAFQMNCEEVNPRKFSNIRSIKRKLCQQMFLEAVALFQRPSISVTVDLFMEQIALCGLEGFEEFAPGIWRNKLRSWQKFNGCYGLGNQSKTGSDGVIINKKTDFTFSDCHSHVTAVAISALAFFTRVTLKMAYNLP